MQVQGLAAVHWRFFMNHYNLSYEWNGKQDHHLRSTRWSIRVTCMRTGSCTACERGPILWKRSEFHIGIIDMKMKFHLRKRENSHWPSRAHNVRDNFNDIKVVIVPTLVIISLLFFDEKSYCTNCRSHIFNLLNKYDSV